MSTAVEGDVSQEKTQCRLCAEYEKTKYLFDIFGKDGSRHNLDLKIRKCLPIVVQEDDGMPRWVCIDCINRLDMVAVFVESCMRAHHQFLTVLTNDPTKKVAAGVTVRSDESEPDGPEEIIIKSEPMIEDEIDLDELPHVLRRKENNNPIYSDGQVVSIEPEELDGPANIIIKAEPFPEVNEED